MKLIRKIKIIFPVLLFAAFLTLIISQVKAAPTQNPVFATIEKVQQMISDALAPVQGVIDELSNRLGAAETILSPIPGQISGLKTNDATMSAAIADLQQRVTALENQQTPSSCLQPPSDMISWWPGDGNANDIFDGNSGSLQNGATFAQGKVNQAFSFDGVDDFVQAPTAGFPTGNSSRTLDLWVKINEFLADVPDPNSPLETFFAGYGNFGSSGQIYALGTAGNVLYFSQWGSALFGPSLQTNRWYHIAITNVGNSAVLYLDGVAVASGTLGINTPANTPFYVGRAPGSFGDIRRLNGLVDEVEVFNRALTASEIQAIFKAGSQGKCKPSVGLGDDFNGHNLNTDIWEFFSTNGGNYSFTDGSIVVPGGTSMFYIRSKNNPFPAPGPFIVEFGIQYTIVDESGVGVALGFEQQNGYDQSNIPVSYWQDHNGLVVSRFGLTVAVMSGVDSNYHVGKIVYDGDKYKLYLDGVLKYTSPSSATAKSLWFGNPFCCRSNWTGFKLDYIKVSKP